MKPSLVGLLSVAIVLAVATTAQADTLKQLASPRFVRANIEPTEGEKRKQPCASAASRADQQNFPCIVGPPIILPPNKEPGPPAPERPSINKTK